MIKRLAKAIGAFIGIVSLPFLAKGYFELLNVVFPGAGTENLVYLTLFTFIPAAFGSVALFIINK